MGTFKATWYGDVYYLKPFTNYSVRVFPYSVLGYRLGSELKIFQTAEAGKRYKKQFLLLVISSMTVVSKIVHYSHYVLIILCTGLRALQFGNNWTVA